jgi:iron(III) transport system permease protein
MKRLSPSLVLPVALLSFVFVGYVVYPFGVTVAESLKTEGLLSLGNYQQLLSPASRGNWEAVFNSVLVSLLSVLCAGLLGLFFAFVFTQFDLPFKGILAALAVLPIALPPLVGVLAFMFVFGEGGIIPRLLQLLLRTEQVPVSLDGFAGIIAVHVYSFYVYFYSFASATLRQLDASVLEAAAGLGSGPWYTFRRVIVPALKPALAGASILTFMASMASFSAPLLMGGGRRFMTTQIYATKLNGEMSLAAAQSVLLTLASVAFFIGLRLLERQQSSVMRGKGAGKIRVLHVSQRWRRLLITASVVLLSIELLPILTIVVISFVPEGAWTWQILPSSFSAENYAKLLGEPHVFEPVRNSLLMSGAALAAGLVIGVTAAHLVAKGVRGRPGRLTDLVLMLPFAIPGTVLAISLILSFDHPNLFGGYNILVGTLWILPLAYLIRTYPLIMRSTAAVLENFDDSLTEAAASFGAGPFRRFAKVSLPIILPGVISGSLLCLITSLGEFVSSILLYTYSTRPISVEIFSQLRSYNFGPAAAYSVFLLLIITVLISLSDLLVRRFSRQGEGVAL